MTRFNIVTHELIMVWAGMQHIGLVATGEELATKYNAGATTYSLAEENRCSRVTIRNRLVAHGVELRPRDSDDARRIISAHHQGMTYDEWEGFAADSPYCPKFNEACRESNREKYGRRCFITGKMESDNITKPANPASYLSTMLI